ncbi:MAG: endo-1,4-beta-xylanase, partial [Verrucomicrobiales bacterium]|nr:endo-1,4-beta-xylanase [Verrucomicrobiales bacterium]
MPVTSSPWKQWLSLLFAGAVLGSAHAATGPSLHEVFRSDFLVGVALNTGQFSSPDHADAPLIRQHFNSITAENALKWGPLHPKPDQYTFEQADRFVEFGTQQGWTIIGHTLVWHSQTPPWVFQDQEGKPASREVLLERMRDHIRTVVGRYQGRIHGWDVVNEALNDDGTLRNSPWLRTIGED